MEWPGAPDGCLPARRERRPSLTQAAREAAGVCRQRRLQRRLDRARRSEKAVTSCRTWHVALGGAGVCSGAQNDDSRGLPREDNHWMHISEWCFALGGTGVCNRARRGGSRDMPRKCRWLQRRTKARLVRLGDTTAQRAVLVIRQPASCYNDSCCSRSRNNIQWAGQVRFDNATARRAVSAT